MLIASKDGQFLTDKFSSGILASDRIRLKKGKGKKKKGAMYSLREIGNVGRKVEK